jgi:hypothetical protein
VTISDWYLSGDKPVMAGKHRAIQSGILVPFCSIDLIGMMVIGTQTMIRHD